MQVRPSLSALVVIKEVGEYCLLFSLYVNVKPRFWPIYFTLDMDENLREFYFEELAPQRLRQPLPPMSDLFETSIHASSFDKTTKSNRSSFNRMVSFNSLSSDGASLSDELGSDEGYQ